MADTIRRLSDELARDPGSLSFVQLADALRRTGDHALALKVARRGLDRHPYHADAHDVLARVLADRGDLHLAADEWEMALRLAPGYGAALRGLGFLAFRRGDLATAERLLGQAASRDDDPALAAGLARVRAALAVATGGAPTAAAISAPEPVSEPPALDSIAPEPESPPPSREESHELASIDAFVPGPLVTPSAASGARALFRPLLGEHGRAALLLDEDGLVLAGEYPDAEGRDVGEEIGAELAGVRGEAERAVRHLELGEWQRVVVECEGAIVAMAPAPRGGVLLVASDRSSPLGMVRLLVDRLIGRARGWLEGLS